MPACVTCGADAVQVHQRHAGADELTAFASDTANSSVTPEDTDALVPVYTCEEHRPPPELAALTHQADCTPPCSCEPDQPADQPALFVDSP